jgi:hypothetical protein
MLTSKAPGTEPSQGGSGQAAAETPGKEVAAVMEVRCEMRDARCEEPEQRPKQALWPRTCGRGPQLTAYPAGLVAGPGTCIAGVGAIAAAGILSATRTCLQLQLRRRG